MADINMLSQLYDDFIVIVKDSVIKYKAEADALDTLEMTKAADEYVRASQNKDTFGSYYYTEEEIIKAFEKGGFTVGDTDYQVPKKEIESMANSRFSIPPLYEKKRENYDLFTGELLSVDVLWTYDIRSALVKMHHDDVIANYVEKNDYYRTLMGLPNYKTDESDYLYVPSDIAEEYSIDSTKPIHELDIGQVSVLYTIGYIDTLIEKYPTYTYLNYLGSKAVDNVTARSAKAFDIIRVPTVSSGTMWNSFSLIYSQCREYFMSCIYVNEHRQTISYYDNFIGMCIMLMTLLQFVARILKFTIERDFFDEYCIKVLFECYNIPYDSSLDNDTKLQIVQNLNILIRDKGTNKALVDIASILGFDRIKIYKYCLFKNQIFDNDGLPVIATKKDEITGEEVPDYEKMYEVNFKKLDVNSNDYYHALQTNSSNQTYTEVTESDPYWIDDETLRKDLYEIEYNYAETKYMGISISYRMTRLFFDNVYALKMLLDNRFKEYQIYLDLPKILTYQSISLFDSVMLLCALTCKMNHLRGNILSSPSKILHVMGFDFKKGYEILKEMITPPPVMDTEEDQKKVNAESKYSEFIDPDLVKYFETANNEGPYTAEQLNTLYNDILKLYDVLLDKMSTSKDIDEYHAYRDLYYALYYCQESQDMFSIGDDKSFTDWEMITADTHTKSGWVLARVDTSKSAEDCLVTDKTVMTTCYYVSNLIKDASSCTFHVPKNVTGTVYEFDEKNIFVRTHTNPWDFENTGITFTPIYGHKYYFSMVPIEGYSTQEINGRVVNKNIFDDEMESMSSSARLDIKSRYAGTFMEYLMYRNPALWSFVESCDIDQIPQYANHIINKLLKILPDIQTLGQSLGYSSIMEDVLLKFIRFFKSYTTDLLNMEVVYILDMKPESMMRLLDKYRYETKHWLRDKMTLGYIDMEDHTIYDTYTTKFHFYDNLNLSIAISLFTSLTWMDEIYKIKDFIWEKDPLLLTDKNRPEYIADYLWLRSFCRLTDSIYYETIYHLYDNHIYLKDYLMYMRIHDLLEEHDFGFYDIICHYIKNIYPEDGFKFTDDAITELKTTLSDKSFHMDDEVLYLKISEIVNEFDFLMYDVITKYDKYLSQEDKQIVLRDKMKWYPRYRLTSKMKFSDEIPTIYILAPTLIDKIKFLNDTIRLMDETIYEKDDGFRLSDSIRRDYTLRVKDLIHFADTILSIVQKTLMKDSFRIQDEYNFDIQIEKLKSELSITDKIQSRSSTYYQNESIHQTDAVTYLNKSYDKDALMDLNFYYDEMGEEKSVGDSSNMNFRDKCRIWFE